MQRARSWAALRRMLAGLWRRSQQDPAERRTEKARARFWAEAREGEREAEARATPQSTRQ